MKGVNHVNGRASSRHWIRNRAWALIAALLLASECLAVADSELTAASPSQSTVAGTGASISTATTQAPTRPVIPPPRKFIPPPRKFSAAEIKNRLNQQSQRSISPTAGNLSRQPLPSQ